MNTLDAKKEDLVVGRQTREIDILQLVCGAVSPIGHPEKVSQVHSSGLLSLLDCSLEGPLRKSIFDTLKVAYAEPSVVVP